MVAHNYQSEPVNRDGFKDSTYKVKWSSPRGQGKANTVDHGTYTVNAKVVIFDALSVVQGWKKS